jgi:hypothetical protein
MRELINAVADNILERSQPSRDEIVHLVRYLRGERTCTFKCKWIRGGTRPVPWTLTLFQWPQELRCAFSIGRWQARCSAVHCTALQCAVSLGAD